MTGPQAAFAVCAVTLIALAIGTLVVCLIVGRPADGADTHEPSGAAPATPPGALSTPAPDAPADLSAPGKSAEAAVSSEAAPESPRIAATWCAACHHPMPQPMYPTCPRCGAGEFIAVGPVRESEPGEPRHGQPYLRLLDDLLVAPAEDLAP